MHFFLAAILLGSITSMLECKPADRRSPTAPPVPDVALPERFDDTGSPADDENDAGSREVAKQKKIEDPRSPIAVNLQEFLPAELDGVRARRRQAVKTAPIAYAFYEGDDHTFNVNITGPNQTEEQRRAAYPVIGNEGEKLDIGPVEVEGLKVGEYDAQKSFDSKRKKAEVIVLVNPFVEVKVSVQPARKADEAVKLLDEIDLDGISKLR